MIGNKLNLTTHSVDETRALGQKIGTLIEQPVNIALIGDLGGGKTAFVQGLAIGLEVPADYYVTSPSFTLINEYPGRLPLFHADLYRLDTIGDLEDLGLDELYSGRAVLAIEWADKLPAGALKALLSLTFEIMDDNGRKIRIKAAGQNEIDLLKALETKLTAKNRHGL
jgi:tRNA threonylcarbamoyladenosine biosynthesis protein TsaE